VVVRPTRSAARRNVGRQPVDPPRISSRNLAPGDTDSHRRRGNRLARESGNAVASLAATVGFPTTFRVVSHPDVTPPRLTSFELTPRRLDTTISGKTVRFTVRAADAESAIDVVRVNTWQRNVRPRMLDMKLARTARDTYVGEIRISPHVGDWGWSVGVNITNRVGIRGAWNPDSLRNLGFP
jgi:hypothetical protein